MHRTTHSETRAKHAHTHTRPHTRKYVPRMFFPVDCRQRRARKSGSSRGRRRGGVVGANQVAMASAGSLLNAPSRPSARAGPIRARPCQILKRSVVSVGGWWVGGLGMRAGGGGLSLWGTAHAVARSLERHALPATPARVARDGVGAKVALARDERHEAASERVVAAAGTKKAGCVVCGALADEVLVLGRLHILAVVHLSELQRAAVGQVRLRPTREGVVHAGVVDLPREKAARHTHDGVELAALELALVAREREHRGVAVGVVVRKREAVLDGLRSLARGEVAVLVLGEPARVAASDVPGARNIAHDQNVLRLGDHGLEVASVCRGKGGAVSTHAGAAARGCAWLERPLDSQWPSMVLTWVFAESCMSAGPKSVAPAVV